MIFFCSLAVFLKHAGVVVAVAVAGLVLLSKEGWRTKTKYIFALALVPALCFALEFLIFKSKNNLPPTSWSQCLNFAFFGFAAKVWDLVAVFTVALGACLVLATAVYRGIRTKLDAQNSDRFVAFCAVLVVATLGFYYVAMPMIDYCIILPRYFTSVIPFALLLPLMAIARFIGSKAQVVNSVILGLVAILFMINSAGVTYPKESRLSVLERSNEYKVPHQLTEELMGFLEELPRDTLIFTTMYESYLSRYPRMGYVTSPLPQVTWLNSTGQHLAVLEKKECVYLVLSGRTFGYRRIKRLMKDLDRKGFQISPVKTLERGEFKFSVSLASHPSKPCRELESFQQ